MANNSPSAYEKKIKELHGELEEITKKISEALSRRDGVFHECEVLGKKKSHLLYEIESFETTIKKLESQKIRLEQEQKESSLNHQSAIGEMELSISSLKESVLHLSKEKELIEKFIKDHGNILKLIEEAANTLSHIKAEQIEIISQNIKEHKSIEEKRFLLAKEEDELNSLMEKNSKMVSEFEEKRGKFEFYARRLQEYYDQVRLPIDILKTFGIKRGDMVK